MNTRHKIILLVLLMLAVTAAEYWFITHASGATAKHEAAPAERRILYYRNPMGLPDTSPVPKKDAMGMDYVPVYEGDAAASGQLDIGNAKVQKLGVTSEPAALRVLNSTLRATGRIEVDERRTYTIAPKFEGWVERLYVNATGQAVTKGQPLFEVYSPELVSARREHALAVQGLAALQNADDDAKASMRQLADASAARLKNWDVGNAQSGAAADSSRITFRAPVSGVVLEKRAVQGMRFMPGEMLYQIADLSSVWVIADVPEQDIAQVHAGSRAQISVDAWPGRTFDGKVGFVYPTLDPATRTVQVRIEIANPMNQLKPAMYANVQLALGRGGKVLTVPASAVIDSGTRQVVLVRLAEGRFEQRAVTLGSRSDDYVQIVDGVAEGEQVVTSANFLLDSESNLKAALSGMSAPSVKTPTGQHAVGHQVVGTLDAVNSDGSVTVTHQPIASLGWPGMTMDFVLANPSLVAGIQPGSQIAFEIVERKPGEWVITRLQPQHGGH